MKWILVFFLIMSSWSHAAYIEKVKGKKALIYLDGLFVQKGDLVNVRDEVSQKVSGVLRVTTVKDGKAIGEVVRGKARVNQEVISHGQAYRDTDKPQKKYTMPTDEPVPLKSRKKGRYAIGGMLGVGFDSMDIQIGSPQESVAQSGIGNSLVAAFDYQWIPWISLRGTLGLENFKSDGTATLSSTACSTCQTEITYVSSMLWGRFHITQAQTSIWVGPGMGYFVPTSKSSNSIDINSLKNTFVFGFAGGVDIAIRPKLYIPIHLEYMFLSDSEQAKQTFYAIRSGLLFRF